MGLIQRAIEQAGIPTIGITLNRPYTEKVNPPRTLFLRWPFGHPMGEPGNVFQQAAVLHQALKALYTIETPGTIVDLGWPWRRKSYAKPPWLDEPIRCDAA